MYRPYFSDLYGGPNDLVKLTNEPRKDQRTYIDYHFHLTAPKEQTHIHFSPISQEKSYHQRNT